MQRGRKARQSTHKPRIYKRNAPVPARRTTAPGGSRGTGAVLALHSLFVIDGWKFLKVWESVAVPKLVAAGYKVSGDNALRVHGTALELIHLERDNGGMTTDVLGRPRSKGKGGRFTINVALGHDFARSFREGKPLAMQGYEDAVFHARLGRLMEGRDLWWPYGEDEAAAEKTLEALSQIAIAYADAFFETLVDPGDAYLLLKKGDLGRENLWHLALYAKHLRRHEEALEWLERISGPAPHVTALRNEWKAGKPA